MLAAAIWDGSGDGVSWHDRFNWNADQLPQVGDDVFIAAEHAGSRVEISRDVPVAQSVRSEVPLQLTGGKFGASGPATAPAVTLAGGDLVSGQWSVQTLVWNRSNISGSQIEVTDTMSWQHDAAFGRTLADDARLILRADATGNLGSGDSPIVHGTVLIEGDLRVAENSIGGSGLITVAPEGIFTKAKDINLSIAPEVENDGRVVVESGVLTSLAGNESLGDDNGVWDIGDEATLVFANAFVSRTLSSDSMISGKGDLRFDGGTSVNTIASDLKHHAGGIVVDAGTVRWNVADEIVAIEQRGGTIATDETLHIGELTMISGNLDGDVFVTGSWELPSQASTDRRVLGSLTLAASSNSDWHDDGRLLLSTDAELNVEGRWTWTGSGDLNAGPRAVLNILSGGRVEKVSGPDQVVSPQTVVEGDLVVEANTSVVFNNGVDQVGGTVIVDGQLQSSPLDFTLSGGALAGSGTVLGNVVQTAGRVSPGSASADSGSLSGTLTVDGDWRIGPTGELAIQIGGGEASDRLVVTGTAELGGELSILPLGAGPTVGTTLDVLRYASVVGDFATVTGADLGDGLSIERELLPGSMQLRIVDGRPAANFVREQTLLGLDQLRQTVPRWVRGFDNGEGTLAPLPANLHQLFDLETVARTLVNEQLSLPDRTVTDLDQWLTHVRDTIGDRGELVCGLDADCPGDAFFEARWDFPIHALTTTSPLSLEASELIDAVNASLGLSGQAGLDAELLISLRFGVDADGFYLSNSTGVTLRLEAAAGVAGQLPISDLIANHIRGTVQTGDDAVSVLLSPVQAGRLRAEAFDQPDDFTAAASGSVEIDLNFDIDAIDVSFAGDWTITLGKDRAVEGGVSFPTPDEILVGVWNQLRGGVAAAAGEELATALGNIALPLFGGEKTPSFEAITSSAEPATWFEQLLADFRRVFEIDFALDADGNWIGPKQGLITTEADSELSFDLIRETLDLDGRGVRVGVISDGAEALAVATAEPFAELKADQIRVHPDLGLGRGNEGIAMMEILQDLAPAAELLFAPVASSDDYLQALQWFEAEGVDVVVDDIELRSEPWFDLSADAVAGEIDRLHRTADMIFVGAAGNDFERYREAFLDLELATLPAISSEPGWFHRFGPPSDGSTDDFLLTVLAGPEGRTPEIEVQWSDDFAAPVQGFDIYMLKLGADSPEDVIAFASSDPLFFEPDADETTPLARVVMPPVDAAVPGSAYQIAIRYSANGEQDDLDPATLPDIRLGVRSSERFLTRNSEGSLRGHAKLDAMLSVGALDLFPGGPMTGGSVGEPPMIEPTSDRGIGYVYDFDSSELSAVPGLDIVGPSNVRVSGAGGFTTAADGAPRFGGTSSAAAHVAALATLLRTFRDEESETPSLSADQIYDLIRGSTSDVTAAPLVLSDTFAFAQPVWDRDDGVELDVLANDMDINAIRAGRLDPTQTTALFGGLEIESAEAIFGSVEIRDGRLVYFAPRLEVDGINVSTVPHDRMTYRVRDPLGRISTGYADIYLEGIGPHANPDLVEVFSAGGTFNVLDNDVLPERFANMDLSVAAPLVTERGGLLEPTGIRGEFTYSPPVGFSGIDTAAYFIHDGVSSDLLTSAEITLVVNSTPVHRSVETFVRASLFDLQGTDANGLPGQFYDVLFDNTGSRPVSLVDAEVVGGDSDIQVLIDGTGLRIVATAALVPLASIAPEVVNGPLGIGDGNLIDPVYEIRYRTSDTDGSEQTSTLRLLIDPLAGPIPTEQWIFADPVSAGVMLQPTITQFADVQFPAELPGEPFQIGDFGPTSRRFAIDPAIGNRQFVFSRRQDLWFEEVSYTAAINGRELPGRIMLVGLDPGGVGPGYDGQSGRGLIAPNLAALDALEALNGASSGDLRQMTHGEVLSDAKADPDRFAAAESTPPRVVDAIESLPGVTVQQWIDDPVLLQQLVFGTLDPSQDWFRIRFDSDASLHTPARGNFDWDLTEVAALDSFDISGTVAAELTPRIATELGFDPLGFFLKEDTVIAADVSGAASGQASIGFLDVEARGDVSGGIEATFDRLDSTADQKIRTEELAVADFVTRIDIATSDILADIEVELSSSLLDYVDADQDPDNNTVHGGDPFRIVGSTEIVLETDDLGITNLRWLPIEIANPDLDGDGREDFTSEVLGENLRLLALAIVRGQRTDVSDRLLAALGGLLPLGTSGDSGSTVAEALRWQSALAETLLEATRIVDVVPLSDGPTDNGRNDSIEDWLNRGLPDRDTELFRVAIDFDQIEVLPSGSASFDLATLFPNGAPHDASVAIENAELDGSLVFGMDLSGRLPYIVTGEPSDAEVSHVSAALDVALSFSGSPLFGVDILTFENADARVRPNLTLVFQPSSDDRWRIEDAILGDASIALDIDDEDVMRFRADRVDVVTLLGPASATDPNPDDGIAAVEGTIDLGRATVVGNISRIESTFGSDDFGISANDVSFAFGTDFAFDEPIISTGLAEIEVPMFGPDPVRLSARDLKVQRDGTIVAQGYEAASSSDLVAAFGMGGILPLAITSITAEAAADDAGVRPDVSLIDFTAIDVDGNSRPVDVAVRGHFDLSIFDDTPLSPSVRIGDELIAEGPSDPIDVRFRFIDGQLRPLNIGPISLALDSQIAPGMTLSGNLQFGGYQEGQWTDDLSGELTAVLEADSAGADLNVRILDGSRLDVEDGVLDLRGEVELDAGIAGTIGGFDFDGGVLPFRVQMEVGRDPVASEASPLAGFAIERFDVSFGSIAVERLFFEITDLLTIAASDIVVNPSPGTTDPIATVSSIDVIIPDGSILDGLVVDVASDDLRIFDDRFEVASLVLSASGTLSFGDWEVLRIDDLQISLEDLQWTFPSFASLVDSDVVASAIGSVLPTVDSRIDVRLDSATLFPTNAVSGDSGMAMVTGLTASIGPDPTGAPEITGSIERTEQVVGSSDLATLETVGAQFYLGEDLSRDLLRVDRATLRLTLLEDRRIDLAVDDLRVTGDGDWSIASAGLNTESGVTEQLGLGGILPVDLIAASVFDADGGRISLHRVDQAFLASEFEVSIRATVDAAFFDNFPFEPVFVVGDAAFASDDPDPSDATDDAPTPFELKFTVDNADGGLPEIRIEDIPAIQMGIRDFDLGPFAIPTATVTLGGYRDGAFVPNIGANIDLTFSGASFDLGGGIAIDPATSRIIPSGDTTSPANTTVVILDAELTGSVAVGSLAEDSEATGPGFALRDATFPVNLQFGVRETASGFELVRVDDAAFLQLGGNSVTVGEAAIALDDLIQFRGEGVEIDFGVFATDANGEFISANGPFIRFAGIGPQQIPPTGDEHLPTLAGGRGGVSVILGDPDDSSDALSGFGGIAGNFGIGFDPTASLPLSIVPLDGMFVSLNAPDDFNFGLPEAIPLRLTELGIQFPENLGSILPTGGPSSLAQAGPIAVDILSGSTLNVSGGIDSVEGGWPVRALVEDMQIDIGAIAKWADLVSDPNRRAELPAEIRASVADLVDDGKTLQAIGLLGIDLFQNVEIPPVIRNIDAVDFGIEPFDLGPIRIGGGLGFGVLDIDSDSDGVDDAATLFGRIEGEIVYDGIGVGVELILTEYGPVLGRVLAGAPIPVGALVGAIVGSAAPGPGTAAGTAIGGASGFVISGLQGGLVFDGTPLPLISDPVDILRVAELQQPLDVSIGDIKRSVASAVAAGNSTWENGFKLVGTGMLNNIYAPGIANFQGTFGINIGMRPEDFGLESIPDDYRSTVDTTSLGVSETDAFGVQFYGLSQLNVFGQELAGAGLLIDFNDPLRPIIDIAAQLPGQGNLLSMLLPIESEIGARFDSDGIAEGAILAAKQVIEGAKDAVGSTLSDWFDQLADDLNRRPQALLRELLEAIPGQPPLPAELTASVLLRRIEAALDEAVTLVLDGGNAAANEIIHEALLTTSELFRELSGLYSGGVAEVRRLFAAYRDGAADVRNAVDTVVENIDRGVTAQHEVLASLLRNIDLTRTPGDDGFSTQSLEDDERAIEISPTFFFEQFESWLLSAKDAAFQHPWIDVALVEFVTDEFLNFVREVDPTVVASNAFDALADQPVVRTLFDGVSRQFANVANFTDPLVQPLEFAAAKTAAVAKASLVRQFELAGVVGTILGDAAADGLETFFETIDPSITVAGSIQPVLVGIPLGEPRDSIEIELDKRSLRFDATTRILEKLSLISKVPLPLQDRLEIGVEIPFENLFLDLARGGVPEIDPARDWRLTFLGGVTLLGVIDLADVAGLAFPAIDPTEAMDAANDVNENGIDDSHPLDTHVQTILPGIDLNALDVEQTVFGPVAVGGDATNVSPLNKVLVIDDPNVFDDFDRLRESGGVLLDGRLTLPQWVTDPFAWFARLRGIGSDLIDGCQAGENLDALACFLTDPSAFFAAAGEATELLGAENQVTQMQLFVPDLRSELASLIDHATSPDVFAALHRALVTSDFATLGERLGSDAVDRLREKLFRETYFRGQIGNAPEGDLPTTGTILGIDLGGASIAYADPDPLDDAPDERALVIRGEAFGGDVDFRIGATDFGVPTFGGELRFGSFADSPTASPIQQLEQLLRESTILGPTNDLLAGLADHLFGDRSDDDASTEASGAAVRLYAPGFSVDPRSPSIQRTGGFEAEIALRMDNPLADLHGDLRFSVAPDASMPSGLSASGSFHGFGHLRLGGLINVPMGSAEDPLIEGSLSEDGLLNLSIAAVTDDDAAIGLVDGSSVQLLINLSSQATSLTTSAGELVSIAGGQSRAIIDGGIRWGEVISRGRFVIEVDGTTTSLSGDGSIDVGRFGRVFGIPDATAEFGGSWASDAGGTVASIVVNGGFASDSSFFGSSAAFAIGVNTTSRSAIVSVDALELDDVNLWRGLDASRELTANSIRVFAAGELSVGAVAVGGAFALETQSNNVRVRASAVADLGVTEATISGDLVFGQSGISTADLLGAADQIGPEFFHLQDAEVTIRFRGNSRTGSLLHVALVGGKLDLPIGPDIPLPTWTIDVGARRLATRRLFLTPDDLRLDDQFFPAGISAQPFNVSLTDNRLRLEKVASAASIPLITFPGSSLTMDEFLIESDLSLASETTFRAGVSGTVELAGFTFADATFDVTLDDGVLRLATDEPARLDLGFLETELEGFATTDGSFDLSGTTRLDVPPLGVFGEVNATLNPSGLALQFIGSVGGIGVSGSLTPSGCLTFGTTQIPVLPNACGPAFSISDVRRLEGDPSSGSIDTTFVFQVTMSRLLQPGEPTLIRVPITLETDTSVSTTRRASIGTRRPIESNNGRVVPGDDVAPLVIPSLNFTRTTTLTQQIFVTVYRDTLGESDERFRVRLGTPTDETGRFFGVVSDAIGVGTIENDDPRRRHPGLGFNTYIDAATVFFDGNGNSMLDVGEPQTRTTADGRFELEVAPSSDLNGNGILEDDEGTLVLLGGTDLATGSVPATVMQAPGGSDIVTPLTSLIAALSKAKGWTVADAQRRLQTALDLPPTVSLRGGDYLDAALDGDADAAQVENAAILVHNTVGVLTQAITQASALSLPDASAIAYERFALAIVDQTPSRWFADETWLRNFVRDGLVAAAIAIDDEIMDALASLQLQSNDLIGSDASPDFVPRLQYAKRVQGVVGSVLRDGSSRLMRGELSPVDFESDYLGAALQQSVALAEPGDLRPVIATLLAIGPSREASGARTQSLRLQLNEPANREVSANVVAVDRQSGSRLGGPATLSIPAGQSFGEMELSFVASEADHDLRSVEFVVEEIFGAVAGQAIAEKRDERDSVSVRTLPDPTNTDGTMLWIEGTDHRDFLLVRISGETGEAWVRSNGRLIHRMDATDLTGIRIDSRGGNDAIQIAGDSVLSMMIDAGTGDDYIHTIGGNDLVLGGPGDDVILVGGGNDTAIGGLGDDVIFGGQDDDRLDGGDGDDYIQGGHGNDVIFGELGDDWLSGGPGDDRIGGGPGDDHLLGGAGSNNMRGDDGDDRIFGGPADDELHGGRGNDLIKGGAGNDRIFGDGGDDRLLLGRGDDFAVGGLGDDFIDAQQANDDVRGGPGRDWLRGGPGDDRLEGNADHDRIEGHSGDDVLVGGPGHDELIGGPGTNRISDDGPTQRSKQMVTPEFATPVADRDVDQDGRITPLDALQIINAIRRHRMHPADESLISSKLDVDRNMRVEPTDALRIINAIRTQQRRDEAKPILSDVPHEEAVWQNDSVSDRLEQSVRRLVPTEPSEDDQWHRQVDNVWANISSALF